jgi:nucleotide-binding universal stress UspA family protein
MFEKIVVGYASDEAGRDAITLAARLAARLGSHVTVVFPYNPVFASVSGEEAEERIRAEIQALLPGIERLPSLTYHWSPSPWPIHALHELASYEKVALIVFGAAREGLADHLHVSLMERMVHPVLLPWCRPAMRIARAQGFTASVLASQTPRRAAARLIWRTSSPGCSTVNWR